MKSDTFDRELEELKTVEEQIKKDFVDQKLLAKAKILQKQEEDAELNDRLANERLESEVSNINYDHHQHLLEDQEKVNDDQCLNTHEILVSNQDSLQFRNSNVLEWKPPAQIGLTTNLVHSSVESSSFFTSKDESNGGLKYQQVFDTSFGHKDVMGHSHHNGFNQSQYKNTSYNSKFN